MAGLGSPVLVLSLPSGKLDVWFGVDLAQPDVRSEFSGIFAQQSDREMFDDAEKSFYNALVIGLASY